MIKKINLVLFLAILTFAFDVSAQKDDDAKEIAEVEKAERDRSDARKMGDKQTLERLISDDFVEVNRFGKIFSKKDLINEPPTPNLVIDNANIRLFGKTAVVVGTASFTAPDGKKFLTRFTRVWVKKNGRWQLVSHQGTTISE